MFACKRVLFGIAALVASLIATPKLASACTAFGVATPAGRVVGKAFDWVTGNGWIVLGERGRVRSLLFPKSPADRGSWSSRFASLSLTTVGPGFPVSGMNEAGLAVEALVDFAAVRASTPEPGSLSGLELVQYALDRFGSDAELADFVRSARISQLAVPLHFLACDRSGACAVIEVRRGRPHVTRALPVRALANSAYARDLAAVRPSWLERWLGWGEPGAGSSERRFRRVARSIAPGSLASESAALKLLDQVAIRSMTQWQLVWNLERLTMQLRQARGPRGTLSLELESLVEACSGAPRVRALGAWSLGSFAPWSDEDAARSRALVVLQAGKSRPVQRLAELVANATRSSQCLESE